MQKLKSLTFRLKKEDRKDYKKDLRKQIADIKLKIGIPETPHLAFTTNDSTIESTIAKIEWSCDFVEVLDQSTNFIGFDAVIGNPPYIQLQKSGGKLANLYQNQGYPTYTRTGDIYCLFFYRAYQILKEGGIFAFITSNKWLRAGYGEATRKFLATQTNPIELIDFNSLKVFDHATVDTSILICKKEPNALQTKAFIANNIKKESGQIEALSKTACTTQFRDSTNWVILSNIEKSIKQKIEAIGTPLKDWNISINYGIKTGCNEAFIIDTNTRQKILTSCQSEEERQRTQDLIKPILRGRDIKRNTYSYHGLYLIATHNGIKAKIATEGKETINLNIPRIDILDYPAVKAHLDKYYNKIEKRDDQGDTPYNLRNCAYWREFAKPKIIFPAIITNGAYFAYEDKKYQIVAPGNIITGEKLIALESFLISPICYFALRNFYMGGGIEGELKVNRLLLLPIPHDIEDKKYSNDEIATLYNLTPAECDFIYNS